MPQYTDKFFNSRMHTELCALATEVTGELHTMKYTRDQLIAIIKTYSDN